MYIYMYMHMHMLMYMYNLFSLNDSGHVSLVLVGVQPHTKRPALSREHWFWLRTYRIKSLNE